jgi:geranylgeranyl reductase family protein
MVIYDALICGAGPSGSTAARYMAEKGLKVLQLEKHEFPRDKACGGALRPSVLEDFSYLKKGLDNIPFCECNRVKMYPPSLKNVVDYRPGKAVIYQVRRKNFDKLLVDIARVSGAEVRENSMVKNISVKKEFSSLKLNNGEEVKGKIIIGAGGMHDPVAKYLRKKEGMPEKWPESDIGLAVVEEHEVDEDYIGENPYPEKVSHFHLKPNGFYGYAWAFLKEDCINIGFGAFVKDMRKADIKQEFRKYLSLLKREKIIPKGIKVGKPKGGLIPLRGGIKRSFSDRILIIGDAAGFVSPIGGDGIYFGMCSGRLASEVVLDSVEKGVFTSSALSVYQQKWQNLWGEDLKALCYFSDMVFKRTEQIFRYACKDEKFKKMAVGLYSGDCRPADMKWPLQKRMVRDYFLYDILKRG